MSKKSAVVKTLDLFLISFIALFFEILFIRWVPSSVQIFAFFTNVILLSSFLGLGIGCLLTQMKFDLMTLFPFLVLNLVCLISGFNNVEVAANFIKGEHFLGFYGSRGVNFLLIIAIIFIFNTLIFITLGQKLGNCLKYFKPLLSYSINILGSIFGVAIFSLFSYLMFNPFIWFCCGLVLTLWFYISEKRQLILQGFIITFTLLIITSINMGSFWSPYYKVDISILGSRDTNKVKGYFISVNNTHHQYAFNLTDKSVSDYPELKHYKDIYEFPYKFIHPKNVLVLGAGSGNDVSAALRMGTEEIYAVEIDPLIASLGKSLHEEKPYLAKNVHLVIDDARSFIRKTDKKFDLITFGYLDAHKVLSQFSSVRMDNFIYTEESFRDIKDHLNPGGVVSLTYLVFREWIGSKLYVGLKKVFGSELKVVRATTYRPDDTVIFLAGSGVRNINIPDTQDFKLYYGFDKNAQSISDDWPYLYLLKNNIPLHYIIMICFILIFSLLSILSFKGIPLYKFNMHFFFLGVAFMLLETSSITRFALLFGSTWIVNSAVIISILIMILLANLYVEKVKRININLLYILLISSLFLNWMLKPDFYLLFNKAGSIVLASFILSLPLLFAGVIFATSFKVTDDVSGVFAYNLLGAIVGGICEYISMVTGFRFLFILAILMYCLSYLGLKIKSTVQAV